MIRSMTAFARVDAQGSWGGLTLELRSVNHRFLEIAPRLPEELRQLEPALRGAIEARLGRGKVDCTLRYHPPATPEGELVIDKELAGKLAQASREIDALIYEPAPVNSLDLLRWPGVLELPTPDLEALKGEVIALLEQALTQFVANREREGEKLKGILLQRTAAMRALLPQVRERLPEVLAQSRARIRQRLEEVMGELDEGRLEQEMAIIAQKLDVDEELDRLETHLDEVERVLERDEPVGRRLDFLMQELHREANTLGSKSADIATTQASVELKVLIEQMREQVQNIE